MSLLTKLNELQQEIGKIKKDKKKTVEERFWKYVHKTDGCWEWIGSVDGKGYGQIHNGNDGGNLRAHRVSYEIHIGKIPTDLCIDHLCKNKICVNPEHMETVTRGENVKRGSNHNRVKTHCKRGHKFTKENTKFVKEGRLCWECVREKRGYKKYYKLKSN